MDKIRDVAGNEVAHTTDLRTEGDEDAENDYHRRRECDVITSAEQRESIVNLIGKVAVDGRLEEYLWCTQRQILIRCTGRVRETHVP